MGVTKFAGTIDFDRISQEMQPVSEATFNASIQIINPDSRSGTYDRFTNTRVGATGPTVLWEGPARIQAMRWPNVATAKGEAVSLRTVVFHIPRQIDIDVEFIREGLRIHVLSGGSAPEFENGIFVITTSVNSSYAWDRRIEAVQDQGTSLGD